MEEDKKAYTLEDITDEFNKNDYEMDPQEVIRKANECENDHMLLKPEYKQKADEIMREDSLKGKPKTITPTELEEFKKEQMRDKLPGTEAIEKSEKIDEVINNYGFNISNHMNNNELGTKVTMQDVPESENIQSNQNIQDEMSGNKVTIQGLEDELGKHEEDDEMNR